MTTTNVSKCSNSQDHLFRFFSSFIEYKSHNTQSMHLSCRTGWFVVHPPLGKYNNPFENILITFQRNFMSSNGNSVSLFHFPTILCPLWTTVHVCFKQRFYIHAGTCFWEMPVSSPLVYIYRVELADHIQINVLRNCQVFCKHLLF